MRSISYYVGFVIERWIIKAAYVSVQGDLNYITHETLEIVGKPDERTKVATACDWLNGVLPNSKDLIAQHVRKVVVVKMVDRENVFLPVEKTILLIDKWVSVSDIQTVGRMISKGANFIRDCELNGKYNVSRIKWEQ